MPDLRQALRDFVATSNSGKYATEEELMSKFPELQGYDIQVLRDFVTTSNSGKYSDEETLFSKFPEFGITGKPTQQQPAQQPPAKKKEPTVSSSEGGWSGWYKPKQEYKPTTPILGTDYTVPEKGPIQADVEGEEVWKKKVKREPENFDFGMSKYFPDKPKPGGGVLLPEKKYPLTFLGRRSQEQIEDEVPEFIKPIINKIDVDFLKQGKDNVKKELTYYLEDAGFETKILSSYETGSAVDMISITAPNGEVREFQIFSNLNQEADKIKQFIKENLKETPQFNLQKVEKMYLEENKKFINEEEYNKEISKLNSYAEDFKNSTQTLLKNKTEIENIEKKLKEYPQNLINTPQYQKLVEDYNQRIDAYNTNYTSLEERAKNLEAQDNALRRSVGEYTKMKSEQGTVGGYLWNKFTTGAGKLTSGFTNFYIDRYWNNMPLPWLLGQEAYEEEMKNVALDLDVDINKVLLTDEYFNKLSDPEKRGAILESKKLKRELEDFIRDDYKKMVKYGEYRGVELNTTTIKDIREFFLKNFGTSGTTKEYAQRIDKEGNIVIRGLGGLAESAPSMLTPIPGMRMLNMYMLTTDAVREEMEGIPEFKDISENEKEMVLAPIGIVGAVLEEIGLRSLLKGTSLIKNITGRVINNIPTGATASQIRNATLQEIKNMGLKGGAVLVGGTLAEAETGALQQMNEYAVKDLYNIMKGKDMFETPIFMSQDYINKIADAAGTEAVGGFTLSIPGSISAAFSKDGFQALDDDTFKVFEELSANSDTKKFFVIDLKNKINEGKLTKAQADKILENYDNSVGLVQQIPDEITDMNERKKAMDLLKEKKRLENKIQGKDPDLVKPIQAQINNIKEQLSKLTEDAIQKQTTGEVSLQPETEPGKKMEAGGPEAGPQAAPSQGVLSPEEKEKLTQNRRVDLFPEESEFADVIGGSGRNSSLSDYNEVNGVGIASYTNPDNGLVDVIMSGTSDNDYVGYVRVYENGKPTNRWTSKMSNESGNKENFKTMISEVQARLPENHEYTEKTNISIDGVRVYSNQLNRGYEILTDANGNPVTNTVTLNAASVEGLQQATTQEEKQSLYDNMTVTTKEQFDALRDKITSLMPNVEVSWNQNNNTVQLQLPVLVQSKKEQAPTAQTAESIEKKRQAELDKLPNGGIVTKGDVITTSKEADEINAKYDAELAALQPTETAPSTATEVTPAEQFTEQDRARKAELEEAMRKADKRRKNITVGETTMTKAEAKAELDALVQKEQAAQQPVTPAVEVAPTEVAPAETRTAEQEADLLEELLTGKKKEPVVTETVTPTVTPTAEVAPAKEEAPVQPTEKKPLNFAVGGTSRGYRVWQSNQKVEEGSVESKDPRELLRNSETTEITPEGSKTKIIGRIAEVREGGKVAYYAIAQDAKFDDDQKFTRLKDFVGRGGPIAVMLSFNESDNVSMDDVRAALVEKLTEVVDKSVDKATFSVNKPTDLGTFEFAVTTQQAPAVTPAAEVKAEPTSKEAKSLADAVRKNLKIKGPGGLQSNILGILPAIWNAGVETMAKAIEAGVAINEAVQKAIEYIRENHGKKFNEAAAEKKLLIGHYKGAIEIAREAKVTNEGLKTYLKRQGLTDAQIEALLTFKEKAEKKPISKEKKTLDEAKLPGYNEMMDKVDAMIARQVKRGTAVDKIAKNLDNLLRKFDAYINATDAQKKALEQEARNRIGAEQRIAPSFGRILGAFKDITALTTKEKSKIVNNIMQLAKDAASDLAKEIRSMKVNGKITTSQLTAIQNRLSKVNFANETSVKSFVDYMANVFSDVEYANKIQEVRKLQDKVKKVNHVSMKQTVKEFASINPERIPANKLLEYIQALDDMSTRTPFYQKMNDMFDEVMSYKSESKEFDEIKTLQALNDKLESIEINKVKSVEDYVALIRDINSFKKKAYQLLQEGVITKEEYDEVIENVGKDQAAVEKKYEKELAALKEKLIQEINGLKPKVHPDFTPEEASLINKYLELSDADLTSLSPEDLYILNDLLSNIKEDLQLDYFRLSEIVSKAYTNSGGQKLATQINASKFNKSSEQGRKLLAEYEASFWEGLLGLGRATSGALQKFVVAPFNRAIASYENYLKESYSDFLKLKKKYNMKDYNMHRLGILTTYLQEYMAQFDSKNENVKDIGSRDWFGEIISNPEMRDGYQSAKASALRLIGMGSTELKTIEKIYKSLPKDANGKVDPKAVYDSFMANDGKYLSKEEKAFFDDVMAWKQKNLTSKQKAANEMNGSPFKEIPFHMMRVRLDRGAKQISPTAEGGSGTVRIEAGTGKERSSQRVGPIMTNFEQIFTENLEQTGRNYYLQEAINDINNTLAVAKKDLKGEKVGLINTISGTISDALNFEFDKTDAQVLFKGLLAARAAETLFNPIRTAIELTSAIISYPFRAKTPEGYRALFGKQGQMKKLLEFTDSPIRLRDNINKAIDISDGKIKPKNKFEKAVNYLSGLPERTMLITSWMPTFNNEFKEITGEKFDINKFNSNEKYRQKYGKAIKEAAAVADAQTEKIIGSTTKAGGRRDIRIAPKILANVIGLEGKVKKNTNAGQILGFFSNYPFREITEFFNGFREAAEVYRQGDKLKAISQLQKPLGVVLNVAAYGYLSAIVYAAKLMLLGDEEDEEKGEAMLKELLTFGGFMEEFQGNAISLAASKYAAGGRALLQMGATIAYESTSDEAQKAKIKKILKNSVFVDPLPVEKAQGYGGQKEILSAVASYVPQFVLGAKRYEETLESIGEIKNIYKKFEEGGLDALSEDDGSKILGIGILIKSVQLGLNLGMGASLPMYNDIKMYMRGVKKEAGVGDIKIATEEEGKISKEAAYKNYKTLEEFQLADPEGYDEYSKEGGLLDQYRKQEKEKREKSKDKRESELDVKYGRLPFKENSMREDALQGYPTIEKLKEANPELHDRLSEEGGALYKLRQHNKRMEELREKALGGYTSEADFKALNPTKYERYISEGGLLYKYNKIKEVFKSDDRSEKMSEAEYKRRFPKEYRENYGPGSDYQLESYDRKAKKRAEEREKMREARSYGY